MQGLPQLWLRRAANAHELSRAAAANARQPIKYATSHGERRYLNATGALSMSIKIVSAPLHNIFAQEGNKTWIFLVSWNSSLTPAGWSSLYFSMRWFHLRLLPCSNLEACVFFVYSRKICQNWAVIVAWLAQLRQPLLSSWNALEMAGPVPYFWSKGLQSLSALFLVRDSLQVQSYYVVFALCVCVLCVLTLFCLPHIVFWCRSLFSTHCSWVSWLFSKRTGWASNWSVLRPKKSTLIKSRSCCRHLVWTTSSSMAKALHCCALLLKSNHTDLWSGLFHLHFQDFKNTAFLPFAIFMSLHLNVSPLHLHVRWIRAEKMILPSISHSMNLQGATEKKCILPVDKLRGCLFLGSCFLKI